MRAKTNVNGRKSIGKYLAKLRIDYEETLEQMATSIGISKGTLSNIELGKCAIKSELAKEIVRVYELDDREQAEFYLTIIESEVEQ